MIKKPAKPRRKLKVENEEEPSGEDEVKNMGNKGKKGRGSKYVLVVCSVHPSNHSICRKSSVQRVQQDMAADLAGPPAKLSRYVLFIY